MDNDQLERLLKSAKAPARAEQYWVDFPKKVAAKLDWEKKSVRRRAGIPPGRRFSIWSAGVSIGCLALGLFVIYRFGHRSPGDGQLAEARKCYRELEGLFPHQVKAIIFDGNGPRMILADKASVPDSTPLYLKLCNSKGCQGWVTFSGQQIQFNGESCEVLADGRGRVMLVGRHEIWSENSPTRAVRIESKPLEAAL